MVILQHSWYLICVYNQQTYGIALRQWSPIVMPTNSFTPSSILTATCTCASGGECPAVFLGSYTSSFLPVQSLLTLTNSVSSAEFNVYVTGSGYIVDGYLAAPVNTYLAPGDTTIAALPVFAGSYSISNTSVAVLTFSSFSQLSQPVCTMLLDNYVPTFVVGSYSVHGCFVVLNNVITSPSCGALALMMLSQFNVTASVNSSTAVPFPVFTSYDGSFVITGGALSAAVVTGATATNYPSCSAVYHSDVSPMWQISCTNRTGQTILLLLRQGTPLPVDSSSFLTTGDVYYATACSCGPALCGPAFTAAPYTIALNGNQFSLTQAAGIGLQGFVANNDVVDTVIIQPVGTGLATTGTYPATPLLAGSYGAALGYFAFSVSNSDCSLTLAPPPIVVSGTYFNHGCQRLTLDFIPAGSCIAGFASLTQPFNVSAIISSGDPQTVTLDAGRFSMSGILSQPFSNRPVFVIVQARASNGAICNATYIPADSSRLNDGTGWQVVCLLTGSYYSALLRNWRPIPLPPMFFSQFGNYYAASCSCNGGLPCASIFTAAPFTSSYAANSGHVTLTQLNTGLIISGYVSEDAQQNVQTVDWYVADDAVLSTGLVIDPVLRANITLTGSGLTMQLDSLAEVSGAPVCSLRLFSSPFNVPAGTYVNHGCVLKNAAGLTTSSTCGSLLDMTSSPTLTVSVNTSTAHVTVVGGSESNVVTISGLAFATSLATAVFASYSVSGYTNCSGLFTIGTDVGGTLFQMTCVTSSWQISLISARLWSPNVLPSGSFGEIGQPFTISCSCVQSPCSSATAGANMGTVSYSASSAQLVISANNGLMIVGYISASAAGSTTGIVVDVAVTQPVGATIASAALSMPVLSGTFSFVGARARIILTMGSCQMVILQKVAPPPLPAGVFAVQQCAQVDASYGAIGACTGSVLTTTAVTIVSARIGANYSTTATLQLQGSGGTFTGTLNQLSNALSTFTVTLFPFTCSGSTSPVSGVISVGFSMLCTSVVSTQYYVIMRQWQPLIVVFPALFAQPLYAECTCNIGTCSSTLLMGSYTFTYSSASQKFTLTQSSGMVTLSGYLSGSSTFGSLVDVLISNVGLGTTILPLADSFAVGTYSVANGVLTMLLLPSTAPQAQACQLILSTQVPIIPPIYSISGIYSRMPGCQGNGSCAELIAVQYSIVQQGCKVFFSPSSTNAIEAQLFGQWDGTIAASGAMTLATSTFVCTGQYSRTTASFSFNCIGAESLVVSFICSGGACFNPTTVPRAATVVGGKWKASSPIECSSDLLCEYAVLIQSTVLDVAQTSNNRFAVTAFAGPYVVTGTGSVQRNGYFDVVAQFGNTSASQVTGINILCNGVFLPQFNSASVNCFYIIGTFSSPQLFTALAYTSFDITCVSGACLSGIIPSLTQLASLPHLSGVYVTECFYPAHYTPVGMYCGQMAGVYYVQRAADDSSSYVIYPHQANPLSMATFALGVALFPFNDTYPTVKFTYYGIVLICSSTINPSLNQLEISLICSSACGSQLLVNLLCLSGDCGRDIVPTGYTGSYAVFTGTCSNPASGSTQTTAFGSPVSIVQSGSSFYMHYHGFFEATGFLDSDGAYFLRGFNTSGTSVAQEQIVEVYGSFQGAIAQASFVMWQQQSIVPQLVCFLIAGCASESCGDSVAPPANVPIVSGGVYSRSSTTCTTIELFVSSYSVMQNGNDLYLVPIGPDTPLTVAGHGKWNSEMSLFLVTLIGDISAEIPCNVTISADQQTMIIAAEGCSTTLICSLGSCLTSPVPASAFSNINGLFTTATNPYGIAQAIYVSTANATSYATIVPKYADPTESFVITTQVSQGTFAVLTGSAVGTLNCLASFLPQAQALNVDCSTLFEGSTGALYTCEFGSCLTPLPTGLYVVQAMMSDVGDTITVTFNLVTAQGLAGLAAPCSSWFNTIAIASANCLWSGTQLQIQLFSFSNLQPGATLTLIPNTVNAGMLVASGSFIVGAPASLAMPLAAIQVPAVVGTCITGSLVIASAAVNSGPAPFLAYRWGVTPPANVETPHAVATALSVSAAVITISTGSFPPVVTPTQWVFTLSVLNYLGVSSTTSTATVTFVSALQPSLTLAGPANPVSTSVPNFFTASVIASPCAAALTTPLSFSWTVAGVIQGTTAATLVVPAFAFPAAASLSVCVKVANVTTCTFVVTSVPQISIAGGGTYWLSSTVVFTVLNAAALGPNPTYHWSCFLIGTPVECFFTPPFGSGPTVLYLPGMIPQPVAVTIMVTATLANSYQNVAASTVLTMVAPEIPSISIQPLPVAVSNYLPVPIVATTTSVIASYRWSVVAGITNSAATGGVFLSSTDLPSLVLNGAALINGQAYTVVCNVTDVKGRTNSAVSHFVMSAPPAGGSLIVSPHSGVALVQLFTLSLLDFSSKRTPLIYRFSYVLPSGSGGIDEVPLSDWSTAPVLRTVLPSSTSGSITVVGYIQDIAGTLARTMGVVFVTQASTQSLNAFAAQLLQDAFTLNANLVNAGAATIAAVLTSQAIVAPAVRTIAIQALAQVSASTLSPIGVVQHFSALAQLIPTEVQVTPLAFAAGLQSLMNCLSQVPASLGLPVPAATDALAVASALLLSNSGSLPQLVSIIDSIAANAASAQSCGQNAAVLSARSITMIAQRAYIAQLVGNNIGGFLIPNSFAAALNMTESQCVSMQLITYGTSPFTYALNSNATTLASSVVSLNFKQPTSNGDGFKALVVQNLPQPITWTVPTLPIDQLSNIVSCVFFNVSTSMWDTQGCAVVAIGAASVTCSCTHLTAFAVATQPIPQSTRYWIAGVALGGASCCLVLYVIFYCIRKRRQLHLQRLSKLLLEAEQKTDINPYRAMS
eukprot:TRINITY_DN2001_c0_g1_i1.p1 TRINITY_DN2001_c0_g1~~TRINITY_DN2001_c0_g1_i1.p1  ORF type:complete len:2843 (-),score=424.95 TRINITY_DN2001_c0_g1_i1:37-8565(-)